MNSTRLLICLVVALVMLLVLILLLEQGLESGDNLLDYGVTNTERAAAQAPSNPLDANNADDFDLKLTRLRTKQTPEQAKADINAILDGFQFDTLKVTKSTLEEAILQLQEQAEALQLTVDRKQIERLAPKVLETSITLDLQQVPLREALKFLTMLAGATFRVEPDGVVISIDDKQVQRNAEVRKPLPPGFYTKTYPVPDKLFADGVKPQEVLKDHGVEFPESASVFLDKESSRLIITNSQEQMQRVDAWIGTRVAP